MAHASKCLPLHLLIRKLFFGYEDQKQYTKNSDALAYSGYVASQMSKFIPWPSFSSATNWQMISERLPETVARSSLLDDGL